MDVPAYLVCDLDGHLWDTVIQASSPESMVCHRCGESQPRSTLADTPFLDPGCE